MVITTYYPAPYGVYNQARVTNRLDVIGTTGDRQTTGQGFCVKESTTTSGDAEVWLNGRQFTPTPGGFASGTYAGTGTINTQQINVGFQPRIVYIYYTAAQIKYEKTQDMPSILSFKVSAGGGIAYTSTGITITGTGFSVWVETNKENASYIYIAFP